MQLYMGDCLTRYTCFYVKLIKIISAGRNHMKKNILKKILIAGGIIFGVLFLVVAAYYVYITLDYHRLPDEISIASTDNNQAEMAVNHKYKMITYNIGYGSYPPDYSFFMEGGKESIARSAESVIETINNDIELLKEYSPDLILLQEVDIDGTRSHHINQYELFADQFADYNSLYAINYDSSYMFYPILKPIGKNKSAMALLSKFSVASTLRRSLPIATDYTKYFDLDRCYTISEIPVDNGKMLHLYNVHFTAYGGSDQIREQQTKIFAEDICNSLKNGNYVICGGDFNSNIRPDLHDEANISEHSPMWEKPFLMEMLPDQVAFCQEQFLDMPIATTRTLGTPYDKITAKLLIIDGFIVSSNVNVSTITTIDNSFLYSDHNGVYIEFSLEDNN